ncbi:MAG: dienelactone hydrolase family protein [Salibacteraceae bacterium]|jgi:dienelactone hydrolase|nr:dienelactone hydrolase family protein [Salibacteraceae bacterium]
MKKPLLLIALAFAVISCSNEKKTDEISVSEMIVEVKTPEIKGEEITYEADGVIMKGYIAYDASSSEKRPGVLVVHEWWGHNEHSRRSAMKLAELGYVALAVDMYGEGKQVEHPDDAMKFSGAVMQNFDGAKDRFNAAIATLNANPMVDAEKTAAIGYCFGGGIVLNMARQGADLDAVASFHGSLGAVQPAEPGAVQAKLLVMNGEADPFVGADAIEAFKAEMAAAGAEMEFVNYPGAVHAFTNPAATEMGQKFELPLAYNEEADKASWAKMTEFLKSVFN